MRADRVFFRVLLSTYLFLTCTTSGVHADDVAASVKLLQSIEPGGKGTALARKAVDSLASSGALMPVQDPHSLALLLGGMSMGVPSQLPQEVMGLVPPGMGVQQLQVMPLGGMAPASMEVSVAPGPHPAPH